MNRFATLATPLALLTMLSACVGDARSDEPVVSSTNGAKASASISGDSAAELDVALVRVLNAAPGARSLYLRSEDMSALPSVPFQSVSEYSRVSESWVEFEFAAVPTGVWDSFNSETELLVPGFRYTAVVLPDEGGVGFDTHVIRDETPMNPEKAIVRLLHAAANTGELDLYLGEADDEFIDDLEHGDESPYLVVDPTIIDVELRDNNGQLLASLPAMNFAAGAAYTLVATYSGFGKIELFWVRDAIQA